jgi:hypothetical protein
MENKTVVYHKGIEIGDVTRHPDGDLEILHFASDMSYDGYDGMEQAIQDIRDMHLNYMNMVRTDALFSLNILKKYGEVL